MFCYNCGAKIMEFAKFCPVCGTKQISLEEMADDEQKNKDKEDVNGEKYAENLGTVNDVDDNSSDGKDAEDEYDENENDNDNNNEDDIDDDHDDGAIYAATIVAQGFMDRITAEEARYLDFRRPFQEFMLKSADMFKDFRKKDVHSLDDIISKSLPALSKYLDHIVNLGIETLLEHSIDYIDQATLKKMLMERCPIEEVFSEIYDADAQITEYAERLGIESESGMQFVGGGFGISGAIAGVVQAEMLNVGANALSGIGKWLTGNTDTDKMKRFKKELYKNMDKNFEVNVVTLWSHGIIAIVWGELTGDNEFSDIHFNEQVATAKLNNTLLMLKRNKYTPEQAINSLLEGLRYNPYNDKYYMPLLCLIPNVRNVLANIANMCGMLPAFLPILAEYDNLQKIEQIKQYTSDSSIIEHSEDVVNTQEELNALASDSKREAIYLLENEYFLPRERKNVRYVGLGHVIMHIDSDEVVDFGALGISFENIEFDEKYNSILRAMELVRHGEQLLNEDKNEEALATFEEAKTLGNKVATNILGWMFENGIGIPADEEKAKELYAEGGDSSVAALWIGLRYKGGFSVAVNYDKAIQWLERASSNTVAIMALADIYERGLGGHADKNQAADLYQKAYYMGKALENYYACYKYAMLSNMGITHKVKWLETASENGIPHATYQLGLLHIEQYEKAFKEEQSTGERKAFECFKKASDKGLVDATYQLGLAYLDGKGVEPSNRLAVDCFRKAAEKGHLEATVELGVCYANGTGIKQNYEKAVELYRKAAQEGNNEAQFNLGICYQYGAGVEKNMEEAVHWYKLAVDHGNQEAVDMLNKAKEAMMQVCM